LKTMPTSPLSEVIQHLRADPGPDGDGMTDGQLLARFVRSRDQDALAALVRRHASMVWSVCRRHLNHHEAEDAFQAAFFVLVRKAADVPGHAVANWLYGVARLTAIRLRTLATKRGRRETQVVNMPEPTMPKIRDIDLQALVDEELSRLPGHYRGVVVLCDLEGMTRKEAARQLGIPEGSVASRLARARAMLAKRLTRRGVVFSGMTVASASAPPALVASTIEAASLLAAGQVTGVVTAKVAALTDGVVKAMFITKLKSVLAVVLVLAAFVGGAGLLYQTQAAEPPKGAPMKAEEKPGLPKPLLAKTDQERMVGNWFIMNDDSLRKGEMWVISNDKILMHAKNLGLNSQSYSHRLSADKDPKQIDITVTRVNGAPVGIIKGIYALDGDELRLCLGGLDKDRPAAFPKKAGPGEVLVLQRQKPGGEQPKAKEEPAVAAKKEEKPLHFVEKPDMKAQFPWLPHKVEGEVTEEYIYVSSKAFIADIVLPGKNRFRELIDPRYLKKHGLTDRDIAYEILDHQGLQNYHVADDVRTILFVVHAKGGGNELIIVRWVVYEGRLYISPEKAPDPKTGIFKLWILRTKVK
jgi:RNA polymerase sigma factor (sigma-70 family)